MKRDRFVAQLKQLAKERGLTFRQEEGAARAARDDLGGGQSHNAAIARDRSEDCKENLEDIRFGRSVTGSFAFPREG